MKTITIQGHQLISLEKAQKLEAQAFDHALQVTLRWDLRREALRRRIQRRKLRNL